MPGIPRKDDNSLGNAFYAVIFIALVYRLIILNYKYDVILELKYISF